MTPLDEQREDADHDIGGNDRQYTPGARRFAFIFGSILTVLAIWGAIYALTHLSAGG